MTTIEQLTKNNIDCQYNIEFNSVCIIDKSDDNKCYNKTIRYMNNHILLGIDLIKILSVENRYVGFVVSYISDNIKYGTNHIELNSTTIANCYRSDRSNIYKAIKRLVELNVIRKLNDYIPNKMLPKNTYIVNHNYLYKGNMNKLHKELLEQRNNIQKD